MQDGDGENQRLSLRGLFLREQRRAVELSRYLLNLPAPHLDESPHMVAAHLRRLLQGAVAVHQDVIAVALGRLQADDIRSAQLQRAERVAAELRELVPRAEHLVARLEQLGRREG